MKDWPIVTPGMPDGYVPPSAALTRPEPQALRVAALERDLVSVRAQRDRAVEALRDIAGDVCTAPSWVRTNCLEESPSDLCPVCTARAVLTELDGAADA